MVNTSSNLKYFIVAILLTLALMLVDTQVWYSLWGISITVYLVPYVLPLARILLAAFLPFAVMYLISTKIQSTTQLWPIMLSTFIGCLTGAIIDTAIQLTTAFYLGSSFGTISIPVLGYEILMLIMVSTFSETFFASISAVLISYYRTHPEKTILQPAQNPPST